MDGSVKRRRSEAGITMIETMMAGAILIIGSLSMIALIINSIASNNRNKIDSTQTMLASSIMEQINSTFIASGASTARRLYRDELDDRYGPAEHRFFRSRIERQFDRLDRSDSASGLSHGLRRADALQQHESDPGYI